ncbi:MAG: DUF167 domain-containing protein [Patescibacteria group bacterium]|nr:DUF167 domain-containing protein [Patescibacteria group bacterium]
MRIFVKVKPNAREEGIAKEIVQTLTGEETWYTVRIKALPVEGKANEALVRLLADHFKTTPSRVRIISGKTSSRKVVEIG